MVPKIDRLTVPIVTRGAALIPLLLSCMVLSSPADIYKIPPVFANPPTSTEVVPGGSVNLTCSAVGAPMPYVTWTKGTEDLTRKEVPLGHNVLQLTNVRESANYTCVAMSSVGMIMGTAQVTVKALPIAPTSVMVTKTTATSVTLTWDYEGNEPLTFYVIQYKAKTSDSLHEVSGVLSLHYSLEGLRPDTDYQFKVIAGNGLGRGPPSVVVEARTRKQVPSSPPLHVQARMLCASTMLVQWEPIEEPNVQMKGYRVYYSTNLTAPLSEWQQRNTDDSRVIAVSGLIPNVSYSLRVLGFTSGGDGPPSDILQLRETQQGGEQRNVPGKPKMSITTTGSIAVVIWVPPEDTKGELLGYQLQYKRTDDENFTSHEFRPANKVHVITGLHRGATYICRLRAYNRAGMGEADIKQIESSPI